MAVSSRHAADSREFLDARRRLTACLAASCILHVLIMILPWSSIGPFRLTGTSVQRLNADQASRLDAVLTQARSVRGAAVVPAREDPQGQLSAIRAPVIEPATVRVMNITDESTHPAQPVAQPATEQNAVTKAPAEEARVLPLPRYFAAQELTRQPELVGSIEEALREPLEAGFRGRLVLKLFLDVGGKVDSVRVMESTMPVAIEGQVVKAFYFARYRPGEIEDRAVMSEMTVEVGVSASDAQVSSPPAGKAGSGEGAPR